MKFIDDFLNKITMYRLVLYYLTALVMIALLFSAVGILHYNALLLFASVSILIMVAFTTNVILAKVFNAQTNVESVYISAFILSLIIPPIKTVNDIWFLVWAAFLAMASKYILAINKKHIFNPVAVGAVLATFVADSYVNWWVGNPTMFVFVLLGGLLIARKVKRFDMVFAFLATALVAILGSVMLQGGDVITSAKDAFLHSPLIFFAFIMLTEPLTTPPTIKLQTIYGALVGFLFAPQVHFGSIYLAPESALLIGNVFSYIVSPKEKLILKLKEKIELAPNIYEFVFALDKKIKALPGQYMEWTLAHMPSDTRGNRRYFTLASSPTESELRLGVKFYDKPSTFKKALSNMNMQSEIVASQLAGEFVLPKDKNVKCVFIAGGIGVTPFRSHMKYLIDTNEKRDITLFFSNKTPADIVYKDIFDTAEKQLGIKTIYVVDKATEGWTGKVGFVTEQMIKDEVPDYKDRMFYISGPRAMIVMFEALLKKMGIPSNMIKTDFFPGFV